MKLLSGKNKIIGMVSIGLVTIAALTMVIYNRSNGTNAVFYIIDKEEEHDYTDKEQKIVDETKSYLSDYLDLNKHDMGEIAYESVRNYRTILSSDIYEVNDDISDAVTVNIMKKMAEYLDESTYESVDIDALASGCTEIIWNNILDDLKSNAKLVEMDERYTGMIDSLQLQIDDLAKRKTKVNLNVKNNNKSTFDLTSIENMSEEELRALAEKLGLTEDELRKQIADQLAKEKSNIISDLKSSVKDGKDGKDGVAGKAGVAGKDGINGKNGVDGTSSYIFYSVTGTNADATLTATSESKYMQSVQATTEANAKAALSASKWVEYKPDTFTIEYHSADEAGYDQNTVILK